MFENELLRIQQEIGEIKQDLLSGGAPPVLEDIESYQMATKIDLTVSRLIRIMDCLTD